MTHPDSHKIAGRAQEADPLPKKRNHIQREDTIMSFKLSKENIGQIIFMLASVVVMGFSLSILVLTSFGTDPCSAMNYGVSGAISASGMLKIFGINVISFGTYQLLFNLSLIIIVILCKPSLIGWGTLGNMIVVGYTADFFAWFWHHVCGIPPALPLAIRLAILVPGLILFVLSAACYMHSGLGMAPYDAIPFIISEKVTEKTGKDSFRIIRLVQDFLCTMIGVLTGGAYGLMTFLMVLTLGPVVQSVGNFLTRHDREATD